MFPLSCLSAIFFTGPCPPTNIQASLQCNGNVGHVTWDAALRAEQYIVKTLPSVMDQHAHICSSNGTSCSLTDLHCGETVAITVATKERGCWSKPSTPLFLKTGQKHIRSDICTIQLFKWHIFSN